MKQILTGLKVMDLTRLLPGPLCSLILADYGADVIKFEDTWMGDPTRHYGPSAGEYSSFFAQLNRNKKSIAVNLKTKEGAGVFKRIAEKSDVILEGFRPGVMQRLGLDYERISRINPRIVYVSITGYGQDGPYALRAGHDINYTSITGLLDLNRSEGAKPEVSALQTADIGGGSLMALAAVMMAMFYRDRTGEGQYVDVSMADGLMSWLTYASSYFFAGSELPRVNGAEITGAFACYGIYETSDGGYMSLGALEPVFWQRFCEFAGRPEWVEKQFDLKEQHLLKEKVENIFKERTREEWVKTLKEEDFCCEPVLNMKDSTEHPQIKHRNFYIDVQGRGGKRMKQPGFPLKFSGDSGKVRIPPPVLGEHTAGVLSDAGFSGPEIQDLIEKGIVIKA